MKQKKLMYIVVAFFLIVALVAANFVLNDGVRVLRKDGDWYYVELDDGYRGFVHAKHFGIGNRIKAALKQNGKKDVTSDIDNNIVYEMSESPKELKSTDVGVLQLRGKSNVDFEERGLLAFTENLKQIHVNDAARVLESTLTLRRKCSEATPERSLLIFTENAKQLNTGRAYVSYKWVIFRESPNGAEITRLFKGTEVIVLKREGNYYRVKCNDKIGYLLVESVTFKFDQSNIAKVLDRVQN